MSTTVNSTVPNATTIGAINVGSCFTCDYEVYMRIDDRNIINRGVKTPISISTQDDPEGAVYYVVRLRDGALVRFGAVQVVPSKKVTIEVE